MHIHESHTHALSRDNEHLTLDGQVCFYKQLFCDTAKPRGCISWPVWPLRGINGTAWGAKLLLMAGLANPVCCASLGHHGTALCVRMFALPHLQLPTPYRRILDITAIEKTTSKDRGFHIAYRISNEILTILLYTVSLVGLYCTIRE